MSHLVEITLIQRVVCSKELKDALSIRPFPLSLHCFHAANLQCYVKRFFFFYQRHLVFSKVEV